MRHVYLGLLLVLTVLAAWPAEAAGRRVALLVANGPYDGFVPADSVVDTQRIAGMLKAMSFDVTVMRDSDPPALTGAVQRLAEEAEGADVALFYFSGVGFARQVDGKIRNYLVPTTMRTWLDPSLATPADSVALETVIERLCGRAAATLVFTDISRTGATAPAGMDPEGFMPIEPDVEGSLFVGASTRLGRTAWTTAAGSGTVFGLALAATLARPNLTLGEAFAEARTLVDAASDGEQAPRALHSGKRAAALVLVPAEPGGREADADLRSAFALGSQMDDFVALPYIKLRDEHPNSPYGLLAELALIRRGETDRRIGTMPGSFPAPLQRFSPNPCKATLSSGGPGQPPVPSCPATPCQRAILQELGATVDKGPPRCGSVTWTLDQAPADGDGATRLRAQINLSDAGLSGRIVLRRKVVPELRVNGRLDVQLQTFAPFAHEAIASIYRLVRARNVYAGDVPARVLRSKAEDGSPGFDLLWDSGNLVDLGHWRRAEWIDLYLHYADGGWGLLSLETGDHGRQAMAKTFEGWPDPSSAAEPGQPAPAP